MSYSGSFICYTTGSGNNNYDIAKFRTSDFASLGSFVTGPYPQALAFSPDDLVVYASVNTASGIKAFDANTFLLLGMMTGPDVASKLTVDSTGSELFAGYDTYFGFLGTTVYDTGRTAGHPRQRPLQLQRLRRRHARGDVHRHRDRVLLRGRDRRYTHEATGLKIQVSPILAPKTSRRRKRLRSGYSSAEACVATAEISLPLDIFCENGGDPH